MYINVGSVGLFIYKYKQRVCVNKGVWNKYSSRLRKTGGTRVWYLAVPPTEVYIYLQPAKMQTVFIWIITYINWTEPTGNEERASANFNQENSCESEEQNQD